jgi:hypothetical protein
VNSAVVNFINLDQAITPSYDDLKRFWNLETIGISAKQNRSLSANDSKFLEEFRVSFGVEDQCRVVSLPRKQETTLLSNRLKAEKRFNNLTKRFENNEAMKRMYHDQILNYIPRGQVETTPAEDLTSRVFYLLQ